MATRMRDPWACTSKTAPFYWNSLHIIDLLYPDWIPIQSNYYYQENNHLEWPETFAYLVVMY